MIVLQCKMIRALASSQKLVRKRTSFKVKEKKSNEIYFQS